MSTINRTTTFFGAGEAGLSYPLRDWGRVGIALLARAVLAGTLGMLFWAAAPVLIGWQPTTVMTGSMQPRLQPGDIVVARPVAAPLLHPGQILLFDDPDHPGRLRMHRYLKAPLAGMIMTKGDANPTPDSSLVNVRAVHGVGYIRVPYLGLPILWLRTGAWPGTVVVVAALLAAGLLTRTDKNLRCAIRKAGCTPEPDAAPADAARGVLKKAGLRVHRKPVALPRKRRRFSRWTMVFAVVVIVGAALTPDKAHAAPFAGITTNSSSSFAAATAAPPTGITCANNSDNTVTIAWTYTSVPAESFDVLAGGTVLASSPGTSRTARISTTQLLNLGTTYTLQVRTNLTPSPATWTATSSAGPKITIVSVATLTGIRCA